MKTQITLFSALLLFGAFLLPTPAQAAGRTTTASFGSSTQLNVDGAVEVGDEVTLTFVEVTEDSRCPTGVQCVWEGNAKVLFNVTSADGTSQITLNTNGGSEYPSRASADGYTVNLDKLDPYPQEGKPINPKRYTATVIVTRGSTDM
jgi:hypothetical protein